MMPNSYHKSGFLNGKLDVGLEKWLQANERIWLLQQTMSKLDAVLFLVLWSFSYSVLYLYNANL